MYKDVLKVKSGLIFFVHTLCFLKTIPSRIVLITMYRRQSASLDDLQLKTFTNFHVSHILTYSFTISIPRHNACNWFSSKSFPTRIMVRVAQQHSFSKQLGVRLEKKHHRSHTIRIRNGDQTSISNSKKDGFPMSYLLHSDLCAYV